MEKKYRGMRGVHQPIPNHNPRKNQFGYERYTQDSEEHLRSCFVALNNRFPNLIGFGVVQYLKQLMALDPRAKIHWCDQNIKALCAQMNIQPKVFREVVEYCTETLNIFRITRTWRTLEMSTELYLIYPDFMDELLTLEVKKIQEEADIALNEFAIESRIKRGERAKAGHETSVKEKERCIEEMRAFLKFTPQIKKHLEAYYAMQGDPEDLWDDFREEVWSSHKKWHALLSPDNYESTFYVWLNKRPFSEKEKIEMRKNKENNEMLKN